MDDMPQRKKPLPTLQLGSVANGVDIVVNPPLGNAIAELLLSPADLVARTGIVQGAPDLP